MKKSSSSPASFFRGYTAAGRIVGPITLASIMASKKRKRAVLKKFNLVDREMEMEERRSKILKVAARKLFDSNARLKMRITIEGPQDVKKSLLAEAIKQILVFSGETVSVDEPRRARYSGSPSTIEIKTKLKEF